MWQIKSMWGLRVFSNIIIFLVIIFLVIIFLVLLVFCYVVMLDISKV